MIINLYEGGPALADSKIINFVKESFEKNIDIYTSNELVILACRAYLIEIPKDKRPEVCWIIYGEEILDMNENMRSIDMWKDPRMGLCEQLLLKILKWN